MKAGLFFGPNNPAITVVQVQNSVNKIAVSGGVSGGVYPRLSASGPDFNCGIDYWSKGIASHQFYNYGAIQFKITSTQNAVNYLSVTGGVATFGVTASAQGADANISISLIPKGTGTTLIYQPRLINATAPATSISPGAPGQIAYDAGFIYVCTAVNTWVRAALATF